MNPLFRIMCLTALLGLSACGSNVPDAPRVRIENAWVTPAVASMPGDMNGETSAGYLTIVNDGDATDVLLDVTTDAAASVHLHETIITDNIAKMVAVSQLEIPAQARTELKPGARHLMLMNILYDLKTGTQVKLNLHFAKSGMVTITVPVSSAPR